MISSTDLEKEQIQKIDVTTISLIDWLPERVDMGDIVSLARSIKKKGDVDVPIKVRRTDTGAYELIWGRRRLEAAKLAGISKISCIVENNASDEEVFRQHAVENLHRQEKNCIEEAEFFEAWKRRLNTTYDKIAQILGLDSKYVYNRTALLSLPVSLREKIKKDSKRSFGVYHGLLLLKIKDKKIQEELGYKVIEEQLSVRELEEEIKSILVENSREKSSLLHEVFEDNSSPSTTTNSSSKLDRLYFDLTLPFSQKSINPLFPPLRIVNTHSKRPKMINKFQILMFSTHTGTHIDSPHKFVRGGKKIDEYPLERFMGRGVVLNTTKHENEPIRLNDIKENDVRILEKDIVLFHTGWAEKYGSEKYIKHPYLSEEAAYWLIKKKVKLIGIDTPTIEKPLAMRDNGFNYPLHRLLFKNDVLIVEGLGDMKRLVGKRVIVYILPLVFHGADTYPVKVIARALA
jgi:ParB/RepB/Spo0J family partition protein